MRAPVPNEPTPDSRKSNNAGVLLRVVHYARWSGGLAQWFGYIRGLRGRGFDLSRFEEREEATWNEMIKVLIVTNNPEQAVISQLVAGSPCVDCCSFGSPIGAAKKYDFIIVTSRPILKDQKDWCNAYLPLKLAEGGALICES